MEHENVILQGIIIVLALTTVIGTAAQCFLLCRLMETYIRIKSGKMSREQGLRCQKEILELEVEEL